MSHDLGFFSIKQGASTSEIRDAYLSSCEGNTPKWPSSHAFKAFVLALENKYPCLDSLSDEDIDDSPWSCGFDQGEGYIIVSMVFSRSSEVGDFFWQLLEQNELIVFDPQADKAYIGNNELPETQETKEWWQFWK